MSRRSFMPSSDGNKLNWLGNFSNKAGGYSTKYNLSAAEVADIQAGQAVFSYWMDYLNQYREYLSKLNAYKDELRSGVAAGAAASVLPVPPTFGAPPPPVDPGIFVRATSIAQRIKAHNNYTLADGKDLGLEGEEQQEEDMATIKPNIQLRLVSGGHPEIVWKRKAADGIDIYVDRGTGTFTFLATDTVPNYTDTFDLPTGAAVWKYRCIYRIDDAQAGQWSDTISITVSGGV